MSATAQVIAPWVQWGASIAGAAFLAWNSYLHRALLLMQSKHHELSLSVAHQPSSEDFNKLSESINQLAQTVARMEGKLDAARERHPGTN